MRNGSKQGYHPFSPFERCVGRLTISYYYFLLLAGLCFFECGLMQRLGHKESPHLLKWQ